MSHPNTDRMFDHLHHANAEVAAHAASCPACRDELVRLDAIVHGARAIEAAPASRDDDDVMIALALAEIEEGVVPKGREETDEEPVLPARARWPFGLALAAVALIAVGTWFAQVSPEPLTLTAFDANTGALVAEVAPGTVVSFQVPVRVVLGDGITVELDSLSTFAVLDMTMPDVAIRLDAGTLRWTLIGPPTHTLTVATTGSPVVVHDGTGEVSAGADASVPAKVQPKPTRRRAATSSDLLTPTPDVQAESEVQAESAPVEPTAVEPEAQVPVEAPVSSPPGPEALYKAAEVAMADGNSAAALVLLDELATRWPDHPSGHLALFDRARLIERTDPAHAAAAWRRYVDLGPDEPLYETAKDRLCRVEPSSCR